jgi:hypothetical protein
VAGSCPSKVFWKRTTPLYVGWDRASVGAWRAVGFETVMGTIAAIEISQEKYYNITGNCLRNNILSCGLDTV